MMTPDGRQIGPETPKELLTRGLTRDTMVWRQDFPNWIPAGQVPELVSLLQACPPPINPSASSAVPPSSQYSFPGTPPSGPGPFPQAQVKPDTNMIYAILSTVLCCVPFGIVFVYASKVDSLWNQGRFVESKDASEKARMWAMISAGGGLLVGLFAFFAALAG